MVWKYIGEGRSIPAVPMRDMTDAEFDEVEAAYDAQHSKDQKGSLRVCGLYEHDKPVKKQEA